MSRKNRKNNFKNNNFWQSASWNLRTFRLYRDWLMGIAMNRVKWLNLPETCSERFLEYTLLYQGVALIAHPKKGANKNNFYSTMVQLVSPPNVYNDYTEFISYGNNGWHFKADKKTGVLVWNNRERLPIIQAIDLFARRLTYFDRVIDCNLNAQRNPVIITGEQQQTQAIANMVKQVQGGEPVITGFKGINNIDVQALNLQVPFISENIELVKEQVFNQFYTFLGIQNSPRKAERMIEEEVASFTEPIQMRKLDTLNPRREACEELNRKFGLNVKVVWNDDIETTNYNTIHDLKLKNEYIDDKKESESNKKEDIKKESKKNNE